ncbi:MAG: alpha/beta hydrolase [Pseudomonadota bacterium]
MWDVAAERKRFTTSDGVDLSYLEAGSGPPFVMIPGWSQTAVQWAAQINHFKDTHRVIAVDMRGHGESQKVEYGYRIHRLSKDLSELMEALDLTDAVLMGHSMGCSVIWGLIDLFGSGRIAKLVLVDQSAFLSINPTLSEQDKADAGAIFTSEAAFDTVNQLGGPNGEAVTTGFIGQMFTDAADPQLVADVVRLNMAFPRHLAGALIINHVFNDWRDVIRRIDVPTLCVGGKVSLVPWRTMEWQAEVIPGAELAIFEEADGGAHFMFMENPDGFNQRVSAFLA